jgi:hypothetical protein
MNLIKYRVFRAQADWTLTHMSHKDRKEHNRSFYHTRWRNTDWLTDQVITEWMTFSLPGDTTVSANKMFWTSNMPQQWTLYIKPLKLIEKWRCSSMHYWSTGRYECEWSVLRRRSPRYLIKSRLGEPQGRCGRLSERNSLSVQGFELVSFNT